MKSNKFLYILMITLIMVFALGIPNISFAATCYACASGAHASCLNPSSWQYDDTSHYKKCCCDTKEKLEVGSHSYKNYTETRAATCAIGGSSKGTCECGRINIINTAVVDHKADNDTYYHIDGTNQHGKKCKWCSQIVVDVGDCDREVCEPIDNSYHKFKCSKCGVERDTKPHTYTGYDKGGALTDYHICIYCENNLGTHHIFEGLSECTNPDCTAILSINEDLDGIYSYLPRWTEYYMIGSGQDPDSWEKRVNPATITTNYTPYGVGGDVEISVWIYTFAHGTYLGHVAQYNPDLKIDEEHPASTIWPTENIRKPLGKWSGAISKAFIKTGLEEIAAVHVTGSKEYTITTYPSMHGWISTLEVGNGHHGIDRIYRNCGEDGGSPTPIKAFLDVGYRTLDGKKIDGAPVDVRKSGTTWIDGNTEFSFNVSPDFNTMDNLGWRYVGYKYNKSFGIGNGSVNPSSLNKNDSVNIPTTLDELMHSVTFYFEPIKITVKHINSDKSEIPTNKNCEYDLPKLITKAGHNCNSLGCTVVDHVREHKNTSLNKYLWPGYILTNYTVKNNKGSYTFNYDLANLNSSRGEATTRVAVASDYDASGNVSKSVYQKTVPISMEFIKGKNELKGETPGHRSDITLEFTYSNVDVKVGHYDYNNKATLLKGKTGKNLIYTKTLNGHAFVISSLITQGDNFLTELGEGYNISGRIIKEIVITQSGKPAKTITFDYDQNTTNTGEAATNLLYYVINSANSAVIPADLLQQINRIGSDIEFKFYYQKVPMLTIDHVDELGNKLWPTEYLPILTDPTNASSKDLTGYGYVFDKYKIDTSEINSPLNPGENIKNVSVPKNGENDRKLVFVYKQNLPTLTVEYRDEAGNTIRGTAPTIYKMDKPTVTTSAKDFSNVVDNVSYEYKNFTLYNEGTIASGAEKTGNDVSVTVTNNKKDRLLIFVYTKKAGSTSSGIDASKITAESVILKSNIRGNEEYNVLNAIPTSEDLYANVITDSFLLSRVVKQVDKTEDVYVKLVQPYYKRNDSDGSSTSTSVSDEAFVITSNGYINVKMPYSYFSAQNVQLNILSRAVVKNAAIEYKGSPYSDGTIELKPNWTNKPSLNYTEGGKLIFKDKAKNYAGMTDVKSYVDNLRATGGSYNLTTGFYNVKTIDGKIYVEYVLPDIQYTEVTSEAMSAIAKEYQDNPYLLTEAAERNDTRVTMDKLSVITERGYEAVILSGQDLPINREYTVLSLQNMKYDDHGVMKPYMDLTPDVPLCDNNLLYQPKDLYVKSSANNTTYETKADIYYIAYQGVDPTTKQVVEVSNNVVFKEGYEGSISAPLNTKEILVDAKKDVVGNDVKVHTPVVNNTTLSKVDGKTEKVNPTGQFLGNTSSVAGTLVLGKTFELTIPNNGSHLTVQGYGNKKYNYDGLKANGNETVNTSMNNDHKKFANSRQVRFTFGVIYNNEYKHANNWIELGVSDNTTFTFTIPEWEKELWTTGKHKIETRVVAENCKDLSLVQANANTDADKYVATKTINVNVIGELIDLEVRGTNDPGWKNLNKSLDENSLPIGRPGQNKQAGYKYGLKLGYSTYFDITGTGWTGDTTENIKITPKYYFYSAKDNKINKNVELYYKTKASSKYVSLDSNPVPLTTVMANDCLIGTGYVSRYAEAGKMFPMNGRNELGTLSILTSGKYNGLLPKSAKSDIKYTNATSIGTTKLIDLVYATRLSYMQAEERLKDKYSLASMPTVNGLDYCIGHWYGAIRLPNSTVVVEKGKDPEKDKLTNGYIIIGFEKITAQDDGKDYLEYKPTNIDNEIEMPNGKKSNLPDGNVIPVAIYELIPDRMDYEEYGNI